MDTHSIWIWLCLWWWWTHVFSFHFFFSSSFKQSQSTWESILHSLISLASKKHGHTIHLDMLILMMMVDTCIFFSAILSSNHSLFGRVFFRSLWMRGAFSCPAMYWDVIAALLLNDTVHHGCGLTLEKGQQSELDPSLYFLVLTGIKIKSLVEDGHDCWFQVPEVPSYHSSSGCN